MFRILTASAFALCALPALAGDAAKGEADFKKCRACHAVIAPDGTAVQKGGKTGPNLWGLIGSPVAASDFPYGASIKSVGASGTLWDEASLAAYVADPTAWLKDQTGDPAAKAKMTFKLTKGAEDMAAYLATLK